MENRLLSVQIGSTSSNTFVPDQGVPQGSPLSPLLYILFAHDVYESQFDSTKYLLNNADDTALIVHARSTEAASEGLQSLGNEVYDWSLKWRIKINADKTHLILFNHKVAGNSPSIRMNNINIQPATSVKYLGEHLMVNSTSNNIPQM